MYVCMYISMYIQYIYIYIYVVGLGFFGFRVCRVWGGIGFRLEGWGFRVSGFGFRLASSCQSRDLTLEEGKPPFVLLKKEGRFWY